MSEELNKNDSQEVAGIEAYAEIMGRLDQILSSPWLPPEFVEGIKSELINARKLCHDLHQTSLPLG